MVGRLQAYVGLGANVGAARDALAAGISLLAALPEVRVTGVSRLYRTVPVGPVEQADFLNAVAGLEVPKSADPGSGAMALLIALKRLEVAIGRLERERWGPREIDLDLLLFGDHILHVERDVAARSSDPTRSGVHWLDVPHASARDRLFVLAPLADLAPTLEPPGWGLTVAAARDAAIVNEGSSAVSPISEWDATADTWRDAGA